MKTRIINNAILKFGLKVKMRAKNSIVMLLILIVLCLLILVGTLVSVSNSYYAPDYSTTGVTLFFVISIMHMVFVAILTPATAGGAVSSERERQTMDVLLCTQLSPKELILGKYLSSLSWIILVSLCLLPAYFIILVIGGVDALTVLLSFLFIIWVTFVVGAISIFYSSFIRKSAGAVMLSLVSVIGIEVVTLLIAGGHNIIVNLLEQNGYYGGYYFTMMPSGFFINPLIVFILMEILLIYGSQGLSGGYIFNFQTWEVYVALALTIVLYSLLAWLLLKKAVKNVNPLKEKLSKKEKKMRKALKNDESFYQNTI